MTIQIRRLQDIVCPNCGNSIRRPLEREKIYVTAEAVDWLVYSPGGYLATAYAAEKTSMAPDIEFHDGCAVSCGRCGSKGTIRAWTHYDLPTQHMIEQTMIELFEVNENVSYAELACVLFAELFETVPAVESDSTEDAEAERLTPTEAAFAELDDKIRRAAALLVRSRQLATAALGKDIDKFLREDTDNGR